MQKIFQKYDKSSISSLPRALFPGKIVVVNGIEEAEKASRYLCQQPYIGIDTETKPTFHKGKTNHVALLQIATSDVCFLFRLNLIGLPDCVINLLEAPQIKKVGLSLCDDFNLLRKRHKELNPANIVELQSMAPQLGISDMSLQKLYANVMGVYISKRQQLTNWEADALSEPQQLYAATDAWACLKLYDAMRHFIDKHDYEYVCTKTCADA